jgi:hypothetical protein
MNSSKFPVYEIDYGWGSPLSVQEVFTYTSNIIGGLMLFPTRGGGIVNSSPSPSDGVSKTDPHDHPRLSPIEYSFVSLGSSILLELFLWILRIVDD